MNISRAFVILAMLPSSAFADAAAPAPSPDKQITLTVGELQAIINEEIAASQLRQATAAARSALDHLQSQINPPPTSVAPPKAKP